MGSDSSKATGTDFEKNKKSRDYDNAADDLPSIPFTKQKVIMADIEKTLKQSIWLANYKRAYRGYLRRRPERNQQGTMFRIHAQSMRDADLLGLPKDSFRAMHDYVVTLHAPKWDRDALDQLLDNGKVRHDMEPEKQTKIVTENIALVFKQLLDQMIDKICKKLYEKYSRGADFDLSDVEVDAETKAKMQAEKEARIKAAALERQRKAEEWQKQAAAEEELQSERENALKKRQEEQKKISESAML